MRKCFEIESASSGQCAPCCIHHRAGTGYRIFGFSPQAHGLLRAPRPRSPRHDPVRRRGPPRQPRGQRSWGAGLVLFHKLCLRCGGTRKVGNFIRVNCVGCSDSVRASFSINEVSTVTSTPFPSSDVSEKYQVNYRVVADEGDGSPRSSPRLDASRPRYAESFCT